MKFPMASSIALVAVICVLMFSAASPASPTPGASQPAAPAAALQIFLRAFRGKIIPGSAAAY